MLFKGLLSNTPTLTTGFERIFEKGTVNVDLGKLAEAYLKRRAEERQNEYERIFTDE